MKKLRTFYFSDKLRKRCAWGYGWSASCGFTHQGTVDEETGDVKLTKTIVVKSYQCQFHKEDDTELRAFAEQNEERSLAAGRELWEEGRQCART